MLSWTKGWPVVAFLFVALGTTTAHAATGDPDQARNFLSDLRDRAIPQLTDQSISASEREQRFRTILQQSFDMPAIARFVLASYWRKTDEATHQDFLDALETYTIHRFLPLFAQYEGQKLEVGDSRDRGENSRFMTVESKIVPSKGESIAVEWRIQEQDGTYKIVDVVTEGVSMAATWRSEYRSVLQANGGDVRDLAAKIRDKAIENNQPSPTDG
jgi:phospholipid transport system substrate-binding protein